MRCPDCGKFVSLDSDVEPEINSEEIALDPDDTTATVTFDCKIVNQCADCGTELTESEFNIEVEVEVPLVLACGHARADLTVEVDAERTSRSEGKGRGTKTFYGADGYVRVLCPHCKDEKPDENLIAKEAWGDDIQASHMESLT